MPESKYAVFETSAGWMGVEVSSIGLRRVILPVFSKEIASQLLFPRSEHSLVELSVLINLFQRYFQGEDIEFSFPIDYGRTTPFRQGIWKATRLIPFGETRSYGWVAMKAGCPMGARATGQALGANPLPIVVPCHRVIASDGTIGGFTGGLDMKRMLMAIEGIKVKEAD